MVGSGLRACARWRLAAGLLSLVCVLAVLPAAESASTAPTVALRASTSKVTLFRSGNRVWLDLGVLVAAPDGDFEIRARRSRYDQAITAAQVDSSTGDVLREIPPELLAGWDGLRGFLRVEFRDRQGNLVASKKLNWCPNSWSSQRINDNGPDTPQYPVMCNSWDFPFLRGMVWGINSGWASETARGMWGETATIRNVPTGKYEVTVRIVGDHARLFEVPAAGRVVKLNVTVVDGDPWDNGIAAAGLDEGGDGPAAAMATELPSASVPTVTNPDPSTVPDLAALPAWGIRVRHRRGTDLLQFTASPWNAGPAPFVIEGFRREGEDVMDAYQYFYDTAGKVVGRARVGTMKYHAGSGHDHWHFLQFARFDLLDSSKQQVVKSGKQGFCLVPTDAVDLTVERAALRPWDLGRETVCGGPGVVWVREVLPAGWADTYTQAVGGQAFNITNVPNGTYFVSVTVNPLGKVHQTSTDNDVALRRIRLGGKPGARTVTVSPFQGISE
jgi:hypothetical protein